MEGRQPEALVEPAMALVDTQLAHNAWAVRTLIERCRRLTGAQWTEQFEIGPGSLALTVAHVVDCMYFFADCFAARRYRPRADFDSGSLAPSDLLAHLDAADRELRTAVEAFLAAGGIGARLEFPPGSGRWAAADVALSQVFDHGSHHRAQCLNMLRRLGALGTLEVHPLRFAGVDPDPG